MPVYCYRCNSCQHVTETYREVSQRNEPCQCEFCGESANRDKPAELCNSTQQEYQREVVSDAMGVHPDQVPEMRRRYPQFTFRDDGCVIIRSHHEHRKAMKAFGMYDKNGYN